MRSSATLNFIVDAVAGCAFLMTIFSGKAYSVHVAAGIVMTAAIFVHLGLHWNWLMNCSHRFLSVSSSARGRIRLNYSVDMVILATFAISLVSGIILLSSDTASIVGKVHGLSSWLFVLGGAFHIVLHRDWVMTMLRRRLRRPVQVLGTFRLPLARCPRFGQHDVSRVGETKSTEVVEMLGEIV